ncbi:MAG: PIN domain-containing protein [Planctomycetes bacterium]|nr:PIN domain-containing protein [Planctomycetota bacterium]
MAKKKTAEEPHYLFLDTQVFDGNQYDFENKHFRQLRSLGLSDWVQLVLPDITRREVERHIAEKAKETFAAMKEFSNKGFRRNLRRPPFDAIRKGTTEEEIRKELLDHFKGFCHDTNAIELPAVGLNATAVLNDYFDGKPPFGEGKKKHEFPDAFAGQILFNWCEANSNTVVVVSRDGDWSKYKNTPLDVIKHIGEFLERHIDNFTASEIRKAMKRSKSLVAKAKEQFEKLDFSDNEFGAELTEVEVTRMDFEEMFVTEAKGGIATVEAAMMIDFTATVRGSRRTRRYSAGDYSDDFETFREPLKSYINGEVSIEVEYDEGDPSDLSVGSIYMGDVVSCVDFERYFED